MMSLHFPGGNADPIGSSKSIESSRSPKPGVQDQPRDPAAVAQSRSNSTATDERYSSGHVAGSARSQSHGESLADEAENTPLSAPSGLQSQARLTMSSRTLNGNWNGDDSEADTERNTEGSASQDFEVQESQQRHLGVQEKSRPLEMQAQDDNEDDPYVSALQGDTEDEDEEYAEEEEDDDDF
jgi:hypothetical protein